MKIDSKYSDYVNDFKVTLNNKTFDLTRFAPGNKYWRIDPCEDEGVVYIVECTISDVVMKWCGSGRGFLIEIENNFPNPCLELESEFYYELAVSIDDVFFTEKECLDAAEEYIKMHSWAKKPNIVKKIQAQRDIWEKRLKKWNKEHPIDNGKAIIVDKDYEKMMML